MDKGTKLELKLWRWQRWSAIVLLPLVAFHVVYQYFVVGIEHISFQSVMAKLTLGTYLAVDVLLLLAVVAHAFIGLRGIVVDYTGSVAAARRVTAVILVLLVGTVVYGLAALAAFV